MDSYEILGVTRDSSDKEIEISYEDLKRKYDPNFNTSIRAYTKYREVLKAYENIKSDLRRRMYDLKDYKEITKEDKKEYRLFDYNKANNSKTVKVEYENLEEIKELIREDIVINEKVSYLYYLLNLKMSVDYFRKVKCNDCNNFVVCPLCEGEGAVYYKEKQVYCPRCHGSGKVSEHCLTCGDEGYYNQKENFSFYVDNEKMVFNDLGDEYYDFSKSNLVINLDFYDKENITVSENNIFINYYMSEEETRNGLYKEYYSEKGAFKLEISSFVENGYKEEIVFNGKKLIFTFYNKEIDGDNKTKYLFVNKDFENKTLYFNSDYSNLCEEENEEYFNKIFLNKEIVVDGFGEEGKYGGKKGNLIIKCVFRNNKEIRYLSDVKEIETNRFFNLLGGKVSDIFHIGLKGKNYLVKKNEKYYLLKGASKIKNKLKDYFLFKVLSLFLLVIIPSLIILLIPYSELMYFVLFGALTIYLVMINALMEVKI